MTSVSEFSPMWQSESAAGIAVADPNVDVVLVDDDPVLAALVKHVLAKHDYSMSWFADGLSAVAALCKSSVSVRGRLILLDVSMPGLGGFDVLDYLRRYGVLSETPVIMLTASASEEDVRQAIRLGATGYLAKPLDIDVMLGRVYRILRRHPADLLGLGEVR